MVIFNFIKKCPQTLFLLGALACPSSYPHIFVYYNLLITVANFYKIVVQIIYFLEQHI